MRIVVTGSEGFIGKHLSRELRSAGHHVTGMDIEAGANQDAASTRNLRETFERTEADVVVHLAEKRSDDVIQAVRDSVGMTGVLAQVAGDFGVRVVFASTSEVYGGETGALACHEIDGPWTQPADLYALSKGWGEEVCKLYAPKGFTALRFAQIYGPGLWPDRSPLTLALLRAKQGVPIPCGTAFEYSFCWVGDAVRAARSAIEGGDGAYNIGLEGVIDMKTVANLACEITGADKILIRSSSEAGYSMPSISTTRIRQLGWVPAHRLESGMRRTLDSWSDEDFMSEIQTAEAIA